LKKANIYIDEFGNPHLDLSKGGTFSHFVYTSIIIDSDDVAKAKEIRKKLCNDFNLGRDMKSSNIKDKHFAKRLNILQELIRTLDFSIDVLIIDKAKIDSEGLKIKRVFYKYFQSLFINKYNKKYESYEIWADKVGDNEFKNELANYVKKSIQRDIFHPERTFQLADEKDEKLIQIADFICGCVGKIFCTSHSHERARDIYNILHSRISVDYFPFGSSRIIEASEKDDAIDREIRNMNFSVIGKYFDNPKSAVNKEKARLLDYLILQSEINPNRLVPTGEILYYLNNYFPSYSHDKIRTLIRDLRYEGLFIISHSGKPGYKLANSYQDIQEHFNHFLKYVIPMLQKIKILNSSISSNSLNKINPIEKDPTLLELKELLSGLK
jgi:hypothetical protein